MFRRSQLAGGVTSQALSSVSNFLLVVAVARTSDPREFGGFAIVYSVSLVLLGVGRGLVGEALSIVGFDHTDSLSGARRLPITSGLFVGMTTGICMVLAGFLLGGTALGQPLIAFGVCLPFVLAQDATRFVGFASGTAGLAVRSDALVLIAQISIFAVLFTRDVRTATVFVLAWGLSALMGAVLSMPSEFAQLKPRDVRWLRTNSWLGRRLAAEFGVGSGATHLTLYITGAVAGLASAGALRGAESLYGPLNSMLTGLQSVLLPAATQAQLSRSQSPTRLGLSIGASFAVLAVAAAAVLSLVPDAVGTALLGATWEAAADVLLPLGVMYTATAVLRGMLIALKASQQASAALLVRSASGLLVVILGTTGVIFQGVQGAAYGMAAAQIAGALFAVAISAKAPNAGIRSQHGTTDSGDTKPGPE